MSTVTTRLRRRDLVWSLALIVLLSAVWVARGDVASATPSGEGIAVVYVAVGTGFADALGVGPGAGLNGAPVILVPTNPPLDADTSAELIRLDPRTVIIIGGTSAVSDATKVAIEQLLPNAAVSRIAGTNRYKTNAAFSAATFPVEGWASISAAAFTAVSPATNTVTISAGASNSSTGLLYGSIQLPDGAEILELKAMGVDNNGGTLFVYLYRVATTQQQIASTSSLSGPGNTEFSSTAITAGMEIVDNESFSYQIYISGADGDPFIRNVMVRYQLGVSG